MPLQRKKKMQIQTKLILEPRLTSKPFLGIWYAEATENPDASTVAEKTEDSHATEAATEEGKGGDSKATETSEGGTREREESGCQRITNSFENFFLFWILASFVNRGVNN